MYLQQELIFEFLTQPKVIESQKNWLLRNAFSQKSVFIQKILDSCSVFFQHCSVNNLRENFDPERAKNVNKNKKKIAANWVGVLLQLAQKRRFYLETEQDTSSGSNVTVFF